MKKVLFATTALIATASVAAADVRIGGYGRFGLDYNDNNARTGTNGQGGAANGISETNITSRLRIQFDMSTETDGGVTLGARLRLQAESRDNVVNGGGLNGTTTANGARFFASFGGFTVQVGNIAGAIDSMPGIYLPTRSADTGIDGMGFNALVALNPFDAYSSSGTGANGFELIYAAGNFGGHISYSTTNGAVGLDRIGATVSYTFGDWTAALGYADNDAGAGNPDVDMAIFTLTGTVGNFDLGIAYAKNMDFAGIGNDVNKVRLYGAMDIGAASTLLVWVANEDNPFNAVRDGSSFGVNYSYDLGGGASFEAGFVEAATNQTQVQAGVYFSF